jgi:Molybdopterin-binding domain of aldehyde dehydrogenase
MYLADAKELVDYDVVRDTAPEAPFRGPGGPVLCFALEQAVDEAAGRLQIDPIALRQQWDPDVSRHLGRRNVRLARDAQSFNDRQGRACLPPGQRPGTPRVKLFGLSAVSNDHEQRLTVLASCFDCRPPPREQADAVVVAGR